MSILEVRPEVATRGHEPLAQPHVKVLVDRCAGCQECVIRCPTGALSMDTDRWVALAADELCVGCRQCVRTCPFSAIEVEGPLMVTARLELHGSPPPSLVGDVSETRPPLGGWDAAMAEAQRCLACPDPTCVRGCPAHNDIPGFIASIRDRDLNGAQRILRRTSFLPDICSRVCDQASQCEGACTWSLAGGTPVAIGALERFVTDNTDTAPPTVAEAEEEMSVGIVGSGPAGIAAAWELVEAGAKVTVYEKEEFAGGLLRWGIPDFTLPLEVASRPWDALLQAGVDLRLGQEVGPKELDLLLKEHDAVIAANGAGLALSVAVPGADLVGVEDATSFLVRAHSALAEGGTLGDLAGDQGSAASDCAPNVLVIGAGNTAMDVARSARRLGADVLCVDWMDRRFALVRPDELEEAEAEGVEVRFNTTLVRVEGSGGRVRFAHVARTRQRDAFSRPKEIAGTSERVAADLVVMAMGYRNDPSFAPWLTGTPVRRQASGLPDRRWMGSGILANPASRYAHGNPVGKLALGREIGLVSAALPFKERLWAAGDALVGPSTVVEAMAQGRRAAQAILTSGPRRPGKPPQVPRRILICYESRSGKTERGAEVIAGSMTGRGAEVTTLPLNRVGPLDLAAADLVVLGTWVEGAVVAGVGPAKPTRKWLASLPQLGGKHVALFCTYGVAPRTTLRSMEQAFVEKGAQVVAKTAIKGSKVERGALLFAHELIERIWVTAALQGHGALPGRSR